MKFFKKIFAVDKQEHSSQHKNNQFIFHIKEDGEVDLEVFIQHYNDNDSKYLANFLLLLNSGFYINSMISTLLQVAKDDKKYAKFVNTTLIELYKDINDTSSENDDPLILPSKFGLYNEQ